MSKNYERSDAYRHETSVHNFYQYILKNPSKSE